VDGFFDYVRRNEENEDTEDRQVSFDETNFLRMIEENSQ
jgi:hypothetical protein